MELIISEALKYGVGGVIVAGVFMGVMLLAPSIRAALPGLLARRARREDRVIAALEKHIEVSTKVIGVLEALMGLVADLRDETSEVKIDVQYIAEKLDLRPLPSRSKRSKAERSGAVDVLAR